MKKNRIRKKVVLPCIGIGMMLALSACDASGQMLGNTTTGSAITASKVADSLASGSTTTDSATATENGKTSITVSGDNISIKGNGATSTGKTITISEAGSYQLSGSLEEGQIKINTDREVKLILDQFSITNSKDAPIVNEKGTVQILLKENTENTVADRRSAKEDTDSGAEKSGSKTDDTKAGTDSTDFDAAIYSEGDLLLGGQGSLTLEGGYE
ncbi:MAG: carbohydrate-binding domain-containing protein, partial [Lachnospiraceae bacterium]|nr:carbohydrate-binding domain-containing protein [Lachnospiraceae bacterium]